jgi:hypothetical protein
MKQLKKYFILGMLLPILLVTACKKNVPAEDTLDVKLSAASIEAFPSNSFPLTVSIKSRMPPNGVTIKIEANREDTNAGIYSILTSSILTGNDFSVSPLPPGQVYCKVNVTVTSASLASNTWTGSFRVLWK